MTLRLILWAAGLALFFGAPHLLAEFHLYEICLIAGTSLAVLGLVVVTGMAGQISLAQSAFVALGSYGASILTTRWGVPMWAGIPLVAVAVAAFGFALGQMTLRVAGHYLALATLAVTAIVQLGLIHWEALTGGAAGMAVPPFEIMGRAFASGRDLYYVIVPVTAAFILITQNLTTSRFGRALTAIRQSETAAEAMGLNVLRYKAAAFAASAFLGAFAGGLLAPLTTYLDPNQFGVTYAVYFLAIAVVGGMLSPLGAVIGSAVFVLLPNYLQAFQAYLGLVFALLLLGFIVLRPNGLSSLPWLRPLATALQRSRP
jgi:branched-chain amino acid transport system permease protein